MSKFKFWLMDTLERAGSTAVQAAIVYGIAATQLDSDFFKGLVVAVVIAVTNVLKSAVTAFVPTFTDWRLDMLYRAASTFVVSALGSLASVTWFNLIDMGFWKGVVLAAATTTIALVKGILAGFKDGTLTPASLWRRPDAE